MSYMLSQVFFLLSVFLMVVGGLGLLAMALRSRSTKSSASTLPDYTVMLLVGDDELEAPGYETYTCCLDQLRPGDIFTLSNNGTARTYRVLSRRLRVELVGNKAEERLSIYLEPVEGSR